MLCPFSAAASIQHARTKEKQFFSRSYVAFDFNSSGANNGSEDEPPAQSQVAEDVKLWHNFPNKNVKFNRY